MLETEHWRGWLYFFKCWLATASSTKPTADTFNILVTFFLLKHLIKQVAAFFNHIIRMYVYWGGILTVEQFSDYIMILVPWLPFVLSDCVFCFKVGIILHYSSLSTILWLVLTARNTCSEVSKAPPLPQDANPPTQPHSKCTIFR